MDFSYTDEQQMLQDSARRFLRDGYSFDHYRKIIAGASGMDAETWSQCGEMGWLALPFTEADGGLDGTAVELLLLGEEWGRGLCVEPYLANVVLAGQAIARGASAEQKAQWLPGLLEGQTQISLAHSELGGRFDPYFCQTTAKDGKISGRKSVVLNAPNAEHVIVLARESGNVRDAQGLALYRVAATDVRIDGYAVLGGGVAAEVHFDNAPGERLAGADAAGVLRDVLQLAVAFTCADAYGAMQALTEKTLEYLKTRKQFGVPLASFQVLQHRLVDMFVETQQTQSLVLMLMLRLQDEDPAVRARAVATAKAYIHKASKFVAQNAVQLHGGIGVTEELDIGHYFRRLTAFGTLFGDRDHHLQQLTRLRRDEAATGDVAASKAA